jgi:photosystem II stability/assembly factor-like uncharacterized protein
MRKYSLISILFLSLTSQIFPQGWSWQNPYPTGNTISDIYILDGTTVIAVGAAGTILKTTDSGNNWALQTSGNSNFLISIH